MTEGKCCECCWHPADRFGEATLHNPGCPINYPLNKAEWERGRAYGYADNNIKAWQFRYFSNAFILGWRVGKAEIDDRVDAAAQARYA